MGATVASVASIASTVRLETQRRRTTSAAAEIPTGAADAFFDDFLLAQRDQSQASMNRGSSPTNHISAAAAAHEGVRPFDPLAFNANARPGRNEPSSSAGGFGSDGYGSNGYLNGRANGRNGAQTSQTAGTDVMDADGPTRYIDSAADDQDGDTTLKEPNRRRPKTSTNQEQVPPVVDQVGERVRESFRDFLEV